MERRLHLYLDGGGLACSAFWEVLAQKGISIFIRDTLPRVLRIAEVDLQASVNPKLDVLGHLRTLIPGQRLTESIGQARHRSCDGIAHGFGAMAGQCRTVLDALCSLITFHARQVQQHCEARGAFDERPDRGTPKSENKITFPMPGTALSPTSAGRLWLIRNWRR